MITAEGKKLLLNDGFSQTTPHVLTKTLKNGIDVAVSDTEVGVNITIFRPTDKPDECSETEIALEFGSTPQNALLWRVVEAVCRSAEILS